MFCLHSNGTTGFENPGGPTNRSSPLPCHTHFETHIDRIAQITTLTSQLEVSLACNAKLKTRLLNALETLDILQAELDTERRKNDKCQWMNLTQELQRKNEEMQEVEEWLIKKGKPPHPDRTIPAIPLHPRLNVLLGSSREIQGQF